MSCLIIISSQAEKNDAALFDSNFRLTNLRKGVDKEEGKETQEKERKNERKKEKKKERKTGVRKEIKGRKNEHPFANLHIGVDMLTQ